MSSKVGSVFEMEGTPPLRQVLPLAFQHVVAMIVGCITPPIIIANVADLPDGERILIIQSALVIAAFSTVLQVFGVGKNSRWQIGSRLPVIMATSFAYVPSMEAIAGTSGISAIFGAQLVGGLVAITVGLLIRKIKKFFPPLITGTVVFTIGLSLYPIAINYMAGGTSNAGYGDPKNWIIAFITLAIVTALNHFGKGIVRLASILIGIVSGYLISFAVGLINLNLVEKAGWFSLPQLFYFRFTFDPAVCVAIGLLFAINSIQAIGDFTATTTGAMDRLPTEQELRGGIIGYGISNIVGACFGGLPTASFSQNVGIVTTTKVINRSVMGVAALIILIAGLEPKFSALLTTIPQCVLGGATISVFASIAMTGMRLINTEKMNFRNTTIVGLSVALGMGISQCQSSLALFPSWVTMVFAKSPVVVTTIVAILLNLIFAKEKDNEDALQK